MNRGAAVLLVTAFVAATTPLRAHDFWIEPSTFHPDRGEVVALSLRVGQHFVGDAVPRTGDLIEQFLVRQDGRDEEVSGVEGRDPAGFIRAGRETAVVAYRSRPAFIEMPAQKFEAYLRDEGLDHVLATRRARGQATQPGREYFIRFAKSLLGGARESGAITRPVGLDLELIPDRDPTVQPGPFRGRLLYRSQPTAGVLVVAMPKANPSMRLQAKTDSHGAFVLPLAGGGVWLIKAVHMVPAGWFSRAEWQSLWASLTFEAPTAHAVEQSRAR